MTCGSVYSGYLSYNLQDGTEPLPITYASENKWFPANVAARQNRALSVNESTKSSNKRKCCAQIYRKSKPRVPKFVLKLWPSVHQNNNYVEEVLRQMLNALSLHAWVIKFHTCGPWVCLAAIITAAVIGLDKLCRLHRLRLTTNYQLSYNIRSWNRIKTDCVDSFMLEKILNT